MTAPTASVMDGVVVAHTALSDVDGERGRLVIRGYPVETLVERATFEDACALVWNGVWPSSDERAVVRGALANARAEAFAMLPSLGGALGPPDSMEGLRAAIAHLSSTARHSCMDLRRPAASWGAQGLPGSLEQGKATFQSLKTFGPPVMDMMGPIPYATLNGMIDPAFPKSAFNYWKAQFLTDLNDAAIRALIAGFETCPSPMSHIIIEHFHGAASRVPMTATACTMRVTGFNVVIASQWLDSRETQRGISWARETFASLTPYLAPTRYVNYLEDDAAAVAYGPNLQRLRAIKTKYDPRNFFRHNVNILPN